MYLVFDTETTGLPKNWNAPVSDTSNWPRCVQIAWQLHDEWGNLIEHRDFLIKPEGYNIPFDAEKIHGISTELATEQGVSLQEVLQEFQAVLSKTQYLVGQNLTFDLNIMGCEFYRMQQETNLSSIPVLDTCTEKTAELCQLPGGRGGRFKLPTLTELHFKLFGVPFNEAHNATADVEATSRCFFELVRTDGFTQSQLGGAENYIPEFKLKNPATINSFGLIHKNLKEESEKIKKAQIRTEEPKIIDLSGNKSRLADVPFSHLHNHTQYSILQATTRIKTLVKRAVEFKSPAVALTDSGNMMAAFQFVKEINNYNKTVDAQKTQAEEKGETFEGKKLIPIVGCEFNICRNRLEKSNKDNGYQVIFLAKNKRGYHNLAKMSSIAFTEGFYYLPRIDREIVEQYKEDLIVLTGGINGEVPSLILNVGERQAEESLLWWKEQFGDDLYLEINRHGSEEEKRINETLLRFHKAHNIKLVATNANYYLDKKDANAHDILLCIKDGELKSTPVGSGRGHRFGLKNNEFYFKSPEEMKQLFADLPEAIENTNEIVAKCEAYTLSREILLPAFDFPEEFADPLDKEDGASVVKIII
jgi:DNA polymerase-3 subunit alpha